MANYVYIATSIDGFIAKEDGSIEWLEKFSGNNEDYGYNDFIKNIDALIMGKNTFNKILEFENWPYKIPVYVISESLNQEDIKIENVFAKNCSPKEIIDVLDKKGYNNYYIDGGKLIQSFLKDGLIDEMIITKIPIVLGAGISLFGNLQQEIIFNVLDNTVYNNGLVKTRYKIINI